MQYIIKNGTCHCYSKDTSLPKFLVTLCTLYAHYALSMHTLCTLDAHSMHTRCTLDAHSMHTRCTLDAHSMHTRCTLDAHSMHTLCCSGLKGRTPFWVLNSPVRNRVVNLLPFFATFSGCYEGKREGVDCCCGRYEDRRKRREVMASNSLRIKSFISFLYIFYGWSSSENTWY